MENKIGINAYMDWRKNKIDCIVGCIQLEGSIQVV
jgi:hypothetical protein